jgi:murein DD-endopeptidase MepM/ murein hydrolase activator NlpD
MAENDNRAAKRFGPGAVRRLRIAAASGFVLLVALAGAAALWLSTRVTEPRSAPVRAERPAPGAPIRLDMLPPPPSAQKPKSVERSSAPKRRERRRRTGGSGRDGDGRGGESPSKADIRRELAALAGEDAGVEALLGEDMGPGPGTGEIVWPARGRILARFGRPFGRRHVGIDISVPAGTAVHAADAGRVVISGVTGAYGKFICIQHTGNLSTCYGHNSSLKADEGDKVESGDVIARSGCSGRCYADHLHFEVREDGEAFDPRDYL